MTEGTGTTNAAKVAFLVANEGVEQVELTGPWVAVQHAGGTPVLIAVSGDAVQAYNHLDKGETFEPDLTVDRAQVDDYAALVLPGGVANPDALRIEPAAVSFVRDFVGSGKPVAAICHAPWTLAEADVVSGRTMTSWPSLQTDLRNAGANWVDEQVVVDEHGAGPLITSRKPDDIKAFNTELLSRIALAPAASR